jgi:hypothetical protein
LDVNLEGTRVSVWTNAMVRKAIKQDTKENGSFGAPPAGFSLFFAKI